MSENNIHLTSSEIGSLWTNYMNDSLSKYVLGFMLKYIQDPDIKPVVQRSYNISVSNLETMNSIFKNENFAVPIGFNDQDVDMNASWLFTDEFCLSYVNHMTRVGLLAYSGFLANSYRKDIFLYFSEGLSETKELSQQSLAVTLHKGMNAKSPYIEVPTEADYIDSKKYYSGLNPMSEKRPLNAIEISHLYLNILTNSMGVKLSIAFAQSSPTKEVQDFMIRAKDTAQKHINAFVNTLMKEDIEAPRTPDVAISNSTSQTFSDKLMMFHMSLITASGIGNYAMAGAASFRNDLALNYERFSIDVMQIAKSGSDIMIKHNWLEQPPGTKSRKKLSKEKGNLGE